MKKTALSLVIGALALSASLSACDSKTSANEKNFGITVTQYLDKKGEQCLDPVKWPVDVYETDVRQMKLYPDNAAGQMTALEAVGFAKGEEVELPTTFVDGKPNGVKVKVRRYTMTDAAKPFLKARPGKEPRMCWGRKLLDKVLRWADPKKEGDHEETSVLFTYRLADVPAWARNPKVKEAFPQLGATIDGEGTQRQKLYVRLTPNGWEALGLND
jgi:hypothetical protein